MKKKEKGYYYRDVLLENVLELNDTILELPGGSNLEKEVEGKIFLEQLYNRILEKEKKFLEKKSKYDRKQIIKEIIFREGSLNEICERHKLKWESLKFYLKVIRRNFLEMLEKE